MDHSRQIYNRIYTHKFFSHKKNVSRSRSHSDASIKTDYTLNQYTHINNSYRVICILLLQSCIWRKHALFSTCETTQKQAIYTSKYTIVLKKNSIIYKNGSKPTINQGICSVNSAQKPLRICFSFLFLLYSHFPLNHVFLQAKRNCTCWPSRHIHLVLTVPTSRSYFLIQLVLCSPTVKVKVCELLRGRTFEKKSVCVCAHKSNENKSSYEEMALPGRR